MNNRLTKFIVITIGIILIFALLYFLFINGFLFSKKDKTAVESPSAETFEQGEGDVSATSSIEMEKPKPVKVQKTEFTQDDLGRMASSFAERFGSFSNQSNFSNVSDLKIFMTEKMQAWANDYVVAKAKEIGDSQIYYGVTTKSVSREFKEYDKETGLATVLVTTRRREARVSKENSSDVFTQEITISLVKQSGAWKVDSAFWKEK